MSGGRAFLSSALAAAVATGVAVGAGGCVSSTRSSTVERPRSVRVQSTGGPPSSPGAPPKARRRRPDAVDTDACARQLHAIAGAVLLHYAVHKRLPDELEGLRGMADIDQELNFTCPVSGLRYAYSPAGLEYAGREERLIVYDASAAHDGTRWGILAVAPRGTRPASTYVVQLSEGVFRMYEPVPQVAPPEPESEPGQRQEPAREQPPASPSGGRTSPRGDR